MISIEQWRARIGLFNCKRVRTATPSSVILSPFFSFLILISSQEPSQGHSSSIPTTTNERPSSTIDSPARISVSKQTHEVACTTCSSSTSPQAVVASTLASRGSGLFSLRRSVFKNVLIILIIAVISQLLVISGDVETNPGPRLRADAKPRLRDLQMMTYTDEDGTRVPFRLMERMRPYTRQVAIALDFPQHDITTIIRTSDPVYYLLSKWLEGANPEDQRPVTWRTLITALQDAGVYEEARILKKYLVEPEPDVHDDETLSEGRLTDFVAPDTKDTYFIYTWYRGDFVDLQSRFASMFESILKMVKKQVLVDNLKQYLCQTFPEFRKSFQDGDTVDDVMTAVRNKCSLTDCSYLKLIAENFKLQKCQPAIDNYHRILKSFCHYTLAEHSYVKSFREDCSRNIISSNKITFKLMWDAEEKTMTDIRDVLQKAFGELATRIQIVVIKSGSVVVVCWFPQGLKEQLVRIAERNSKIAELTEMGVVSLTIGSTELIVEKEKEITLKEVHPLLEGCTLQHGLVVEKVSLLSLVDEYAVLLLVLRSTQLSRGVLTKVTYFLSDFCEESSICECSSLSAVIDMLQEKMKIFIFNVDALSASSKHLDNSQVNRLIQQYKQRVNNFLEKTPIKQLLWKRSLCNQMANCDYFETITVKLGEKKAGEDTLKALNRLTYKLFGVSSKAMILSHNDGCNCITWLTPMSLGPTLRTAARNLSTNELARHGVLKIMIGLQIPPLEEQHAEQTSKLMDQEGQLESMTDFTSGEKEVNFNVAVAATAAAKAKQLEELSDDESSGEQTDEIKAKSPPLATKSHKSVTELHLLPQDTEIEYQCPVCYEAFTDDLTPYLTECGHHLCGNCRDQLLNNSQTKCPACNQQGMLNNARPDNYFRRLVKNLKVHCSEYIEGCEWDGVLKDLNNHLDPAKRQCGIACPFGCGDKARSSDMKKHTRHCHNRMISCENCDYYNTFTIVTEQHYPICPQSTTTAITPVTASPQYQYNQAPIEFNIGDFSEKKQANKEWLSAPFYTHNRDYKFRLKVYPNGIRDSSGSHLSVHVVLMSGKQPFEGDIQIELLNWREDKNHHSATICFNSHNHTVYRVTSQDTATHNGQPDQFISHQDLAPTTNTRYLLGDFFKLRVSVAIYSTPPSSLTPKWMMGAAATPLSSHDDSSQPTLAQFTISEFSKRKEFNNMYFSPPFTTSPQGYKFSIKVMANGCKSGKGTNITISAMIMKGQHDEHLEWPFTGTIIIEVLNWLEDKEHFKQVFSIDPNDGLVRVKVNEGEYGNDFGFFKFISHVALPFNESTNTQYLYEDCICVRVSKSRAADD